MSGQIKYPLRQGLSMRLWTLFIFILVNIVFLILDALDIYGLPGSISAVTFVSLGYAAILVVSVIASIQVYRGMFTAPSGYITALAPIPGWKMLLGRIIAVLVPNFVLNLIGIAGVVYHSLRIPYPDGIRTLIENERSWRLLETHLADIVWMALFSLLTALFVITAIFFVCALVKSVLFKMRLRILLGMVTFCVVLYVFNLLDFSMALFAPISRYGLLFFINIATGFNLASVMYLILTLAKTVLLFFVSAYLIDRRINV